MRYVVALNYPEQYYQDMTLRASLERRALAHTIRMARVDGYVPVEGRDYEQQWTMAPGNEPNDRSGWATPQRVLRTIIEVVPA